MLIQLIRGRWYDEHGNLVSNDKKKEIRKEIRTELDKELNDSKFENQLKRLIIKIIKYL